MSTDDDTPENTFPGFENETQQFLFDLNSRLDEISNFTGKFDVIFAIFSCIINSFHILILSQKSMRKSVINIIMMTISMNYIMYLMILANLRLRQTEEVENPACTPPTTYISLQIEIFFYAVQLFSLHSATWLGILMAFIRLIIIKFPFNYKLQKIGKPKNGIKLILAVSVLCIPISFLYYFRFKVGVYDDWIPDESCLGFPENYSMPSYGMEQSDLYSYNNLIFYRIYLMSEGIFAKLIPAILYPLLTIFLLKQLKSGKENRQKLTSILEDHRADKTTALVITMTISHLICDLPKGLLSLSQSYLITVIGFLMITSSVAILLTTLFIFNTVIQCFICCALSSNYRMTAGQIFGRFDFHRNRNEVSSTTLVI